MLEAQLLSRMEPGHLGGGMRSAEGCGDDTRQSGAQGGVSPEGFTHGTSAQRQKRLEVGMRTGDPAACDPFSGEG